MLDESHTAGNIFTATPDAELVRMFMELRTRRAARKADYEKDDTRDRGEQDKIENEFLARFNARGIDSVSATGVGTAYRSRRTAAKIVDWDAFSSFIRDNDAWSMLERRPSKEAIVEYVSELGDLPPGIDWTETHTVNFRTK